MKTCIEGETSKTRCTSGGFEPRYLSWLTRLPEAEKEGAGGGLIGGWRQGAVEIWSEASKRRPIQKTQVQCERGLQAFVDREGLSYQLIRCENIYCNSACHVGAERES